MTSNHHTITKDSLWRKARQCFTLYKLLTNDNNNFIFNDTHPTERWAWYCVANSYNINIETNICCDIHRRDFYSGYEAYYIIQSFKITKLISRQIFDGLDDTTKKAWKGVANFLVSNIIYF